MTASAHDWPHLWRDLADPGDPACPGGATCQVNLRPEYFVHLCQHLLAASEPWREFLPGELLVYLRRALDRQELEAVTPAEVGAFLDWLGGQLHRALLQPRAVTAESRFSEGYDSWQAIWEVVLPAGALVAVRRAKKQNRVRSCYFQRGANRQLPSLRWRNLCERLVRRYQALGGAASDGVLPGPHDTFAVLQPGEVLEERRDVRFVTPAEWGFAGPEAGSAWSPPLPEWR